MPSTLVLRRPASFLAVCLALGACAGPGTDVHLAPFFTHLSTPGGGLRTEILFGAGVDQYPPIGARGPAGYRRLGLRPLLTRWESPEGEVEAHFLAPFGRATWGERHATSRLVPIWYTNAYVTTEGKSKWDLVALPGIFWSRTDDGEDRWAWFPFYGNIRDFLTFDRLTFVLFPLFITAKRGEERTVYVLFPVLGWSRGGEARDLHVWPLFGRSRKAGDHDRRYWLWPFFHYHRNHLEGGRIEPETKWMVFPLLGRTRRGTYRSTTLLWPLFGFARDPRADFWALDAPWPLVRFQRGGKRPTAETRSRVWPFYGHHRGDNLETWTYLWPIVHVRHETYSYAERRSFHVLPFVQSWRRKDKQGGPDGTYFKLWPLFQSEREGIVERSAFPDLNPFPQNLALDFHYGWIYELLRVERDEFGRSTRSWGALWRSEEGPAETRHSLAGLWARRVWSEDGREAHAYSLLFGLLRWKSVRGEGLSLMRPALPGPGWPPFPAVPVTPEDAE